MSLVKSLRCQCHPNFVYASAGTFRQHLKSERHKTWELRQRVDDLQKRAVRAENDAVSDKKELMYILRNRTTLMKVGRTCNLNPKTLRRRYQTTLGANFRIFYWRVHDSKAVELNFGRKFAKMKLSLEVYDAGFFLDYVQYLSKIADSDPMVNFL